LPLKIKRMEQKPTSHRIDILSRTIIALALGILVGAMLSLVGLNALERHISALLIGFVVLVVILAGLSFILVQNKEAVLKRLFGVTNTDLSEAKEMAQSLFRHSWDRDFDQAKEDFNALFTKVFAWYSWMSFRRWVVMVFNALFVGFGGLLGTVLIFNQNKLLVRQNELLQRQNTRLDQQTYLQEADRRSSLIFLMGNLLDALDKELKDDIGQPGVRDLSPQLMGRVIALSNSLRPYRYLEQDSLVLREISPERGQLLLSLVNSQIENGSLRRIFQNADFSFSDLKGAMLSGEYLAGINLSSANLHGATLDEADLSGADLSDADLGEAILARARLREARLRNSNLQRAYLESADLRRANLYGADLRRANLALAQLQQAHFSTADLRAANLSSAVFQRATLDQAQLDSAEVAEFDWLERLGSMGRDSIAGANYLIFNYKVDSVKTELGYLYVLLLKKNEPAKR
jgi:uncharacterized protein YjbI with pentapeptide repeats